jgi:hypothetical protein
MALDYLADRALKQHLAWAVTTKAVASATAVLAKSIRYARSGDNYRIAVTKA